jgi:MarR-like DNA-binding transcriptional regulator SgrR of sgrS sRNA
MPGRDTEFSLSAVTAVFENRGDYAEPLTASEVADELECSRRTALNKLHELE